MKKYSYIISGAFILFGSLLVLNCSAVNSGIISSDISSDFSTLLAEDLVLTSPTAQRTPGYLFSTGPSYVLLGDVVAMIGPSPGDSPSEKKHALETLIADTPPPSCAISINLQNSGRANCYGPSVSWVNHELDASSGTWPGGDLGIWDASDALTGEACSAAQLNAQLRGAISIVDTAQFIAAGMACVANKNNQLLPAAPSSSLDLTSFMSGIVTINATTMTVTSAGILREANDTSGNSVYVTTLAGTAGTKTFEIRVKHIPTSSDDSTNKGKISVKMTDTSGGGSTDGASLEYEKNSATSAKLLLKKTNFNGTSGDPFVSSTNFSVDYSKPWNNNADYLLASLNPSDFTGTFAYAWQAGSGDSHSRTFNAIIAESSGLVASDTFFGFGPRMQSGPGTIDGMICAWTGPDQNHTPVPFVQHQQLLLDSSGPLSSGIFLPNGINNITFDPVADCEAASSTTMAVSWFDGSVSQTVSVSSTLTVLTPVSHVSATLTIPSAPANVD
ncbi:MAG: hypothetical protein K0R29_1369 [Pseudobdellovibrio sp.]|jgi:hypothetical protein|nr:hypothetical protein [Pseudobdellovibrio sp.]